MLLIIGAGFYFRFAPLTNWLEHKERFLFGKEQIPLMLTVDSYFYLDIAQELQGKTYTRLDPRRQVPVGHTRPSTPPLLSVLISKISTLTGRSLEWVALFLPPFLGVLLAIPAYLMGYGLAIRSRWRLIDEGQRQVSARLMGLVTAFFALFSPFFVERSGVGWCDTDVLNVTFPLLLAFLALKLSDSSGLKERALYFAGFFITCLLFLWWWDQSYIPVFSFTAVPFTVAFFFILYRSPREVVVIILFALVLVVGIGLWKGFSLFNPATYFDSLSGMTSYITSDNGNSPFRPSGMSVTEQIPASLKTIMAKSAGGAVGFVLACLGVLLLSFLVRGYILYLAAIFIVAFLSTKGPRFLIFTAPLFGLGIGTFCFFIYHVIKKIPLKLVTLAVVLLVASWGAVISLQSLDRRVPRRSPVLFEAMQKINNNTPEDAVIWGSWGHGHPLVYYSQRGTIADGMYHSAELQYVINYPLAVNDFRSAANWISFYVVRGPKGLRRANKLFGKGQNDWAEGVPALQELLLAGVAGSRKILKNQYDLDPQQIEKNLEFLFPGNPRPILLFLDYLLLNQPWFKLGRWDLTNRSGPENATYVAMNEVRITKDKKIVARNKRDKLVIDPDNGIVTQGNKRIPLISLNIHNGKKLNRKKYKKKSGLIAEIFLPGRIGVLTNSDTADTVLTKLYFEYTYNRRYFALVDTESPFYSIWQVYGERYTR